MAISKRNRRGIWVLILSCVVLAYVPRVIANWTDQEIKVSHKALEVAETEVRIKQKKREAKRTKYTKKKKSFSAPEAKFDPNSYLKEDWIQLGLSEKQADVVLKFTSRGVYSNDELKKIFVIPDEVFDLIKDSTFYPEQRTDFDSSKKSPEPNWEIVDLNVASFEELKTLPGIGDFYAEKIIEQRENLGGFIGTYQLLELWKFGSERYDRIKDRIVVVGEPVKMNINEADVDDLKKHPYISYKVANSIVKMRNVHGPYAMLEDLLKSVLIDRELFAKIQPYLTL